MFSTLSAKLATETARDTESLQVSASFADTGALCRDEARGFKREE
jgi:hypothetical protein